MFKHTVQTDCRLIHLCDSWHQILRSLWRVDLASTSHHGDHYREQVWNFANFTATSDGLDFRRMWGNHYKAPPKFDDQGIMGNIPMGMVKFEICAISILVSLQHYLHCRRYLRLSTQHHCVVKITLQLCHIPSHIHNTLDPAHTATAHSMTHGLHHPIAALPCGRYISN